MKPIRLTKHAQFQADIRGATVQEVEESIRNGAQEHAKNGRIGYRMNFAYNNKWQDTFYPIKQVMPIVVEEETEIVVITVYTFYF